MLKHVDEYDDIMDFFKDLHQEIMRECNIPHVLYYCVYCNRNHWFDSQIGFEHTHYGLIFIAGKRVSLEDEINKPLIWKMAFPKPSDGCIVLQDSVVGEGE